MPQFTLATTGTEVLPPAPRRQSAIFQNTDGTITIWLSNDHANAITTGTADIKLVAGASITVSTRDDGEVQVTDRWSAIAESGTPKLVVKEFHGTAARRPEAVIRG